MKISILGSGYVGLITGVCFADLGNDVICVDIDENKIEKLNKGIMSIYEPGLKELCIRNIQSKRLKFTTNTKEGIQNSDIIFIAVGTPPGKDYRADLSFVKAVAKDIGKYMNSYKIIVNKSTVPVGTGDMVKNIILDNQQTCYEFDVISNPEFLKKGTAIKDFTNPDRIVIGTDSEKAKEVMHKLYQGIIRADKPILFTDIRSAEIIKYASNAMLATRISFMNEVAKLCENAGGDIKIITKGIGLDNRIGPRFLQAGLGYGGSCFSKDVNALRMTMEEFGVNSRILPAVNYINKDQKQSAVPKVMQLLPDIKDKNIAIWGLAFKPKTDDMRGAPSLTIIKELKRLGANIQVFDPEAQDNAKKLLPQGIRYCSTPYEALENADCLVLVTEWNEFRNLNKENMKSIMRQPNIVDGRNVWNPQEMKNEGFNYIGVGRKRDEI